MSPLSFLTVIFLLLAGGGPASGSLDPPTISSGGVRNAADYSENIAPGSIVAIFGVNLASQKAMASGLPLPQKLANVEVLLTDGTIARKAAIAFVSKGQINAQLPFDLWHSSIQLRIRNSGVEGNTVTVKLGAAGPACYTWTGDGTGHVAAIHAADWKLVNEVNPAKAGEWVILYATGLGPVTHPPSVGGPGGDNGTFGPLNRVNGKVSVTIGGQEAQQVVALLAPGFVGLYQINVLIPESVGAGNQPVVIRAGNMVSGPKAWIAVAGKVVSTTKPEDAVQRALRAQVGGDINGFLAECATSKYAAADLNGTRRLLGVVRDHSTLSGFQFQHRATGYTADGSMAVVRATVSYTARTKDGAHQMAHGMLAFLERINGAWKILRIAPDELLNQELYEDAATRGAKSYGVGAPRDARAINLKEFNKAIDKLLQDGHLNKSKLARAVTFGVVGQVPVVGDTIANINQVFEAGENAWGAVTETYQHGFTAIGLLKVKQVGVGILQIVTEAVPGLDAQADLVQASLEQLGHNLEIARDLGQLKLTLGQIPDGSVKLHPYLFQYPAYLFRYPAGLEMDPMSPAPAQSFGTPVGKIRVTAPAALDQQVPLMIAGEIPFGASSPAAAFVKNLGAQQRGGTLYLPVEIGYMAAADASQGDIILDGYQRYRTDTSVSRVVSWAATCRRGKQKLAVRLRNGETTPAVTVVNEFMNKVDDLRLNGASANGVSVAAKKSVAGLRVIGTGPQLEQRFWPDLTNRGKCLDLAIKNPEVASVDRADTLTIHGIKKGDTTLDLLLIGSADPTAHAPEIQRSIPVKVTGEAGPLFHQQWKALFYNAEWNVNVDLTISSANGELTLTSDRMFQNLRMFEFGTPGGTFTITATVSGVTKRNGETPANLVIKGTLSSSGGLVEGTTFTRDVTVQPGASGLNGVVYLRMSISQREQDGSLRWLAGDNVFQVSIFAQ